MLWLKWNLKLKACRLSKYCNLMIAYWRNMKMDKYLGASCRKIYAFEGEKLTGVEMMKDRVGVEETNEI
jgi:hypothetical protein